MYHAGGAVLIRSATRKGASWTMNNHRRDDTETATGALVDCPSCGLPAEITDRFMLAGAPAPVEHVKIVCIRRHWYTLPVDTLPVGAPASEHPSVRGITQHG
jgi:hypothetical protein